VAGYDSPELLVAGAGGALAALKTTRPVPVKAPFDWPKVYDALQRAIGRATSHHSAET